MQQNKETIMASNRSLAEQNLILQPRLDHQKNELTKCYRCLQEQFEAFQLRKSTLGGDTKICFFPPLILPLTCSMSLLTHSLSVFISPLLARAICLFFPSRFSSNVVQSKRLRKPPWNKAHHQKLVTGLKFFKV